MVNLKKLRNTDRGELAPQFAVLLAPKSRPLDITAEARRNRFRHCAIAPIDAVRFQEEWDDAFPQHPCQHLQPQLTSVFRAKPLPYKIKGQVADR
jgi:hypothetical protein